MDAGDAAQVGAAGAPLAGLPCHLHILCCWYALHTLLLPSGFCPSTSLPSAFEQLSAASRGRAVIPSKPPSPMLGQTRQGGGGEGGWGACHDRELHTVLNNTFLTGKVL